MSNQRLHRFFVKYLTIISVSGPNSATWRKRFVEFSDLFEKFTCSTAIELPEYAPTDADVSTFCSAPDLFRYSLGFFQARQLAFEGCMTAATTDELATKAAGGPKSW